MMKLKAHRLYGNYNRDPNWYRKFGKKCNFFNRQGISSIFTRIPSYISGDTFKLWCQENDININKTIGKRTKKRIIKNFKRDMRMNARLHYSKEMEKISPILKINPNVKKISKINNILHNFHNFQIDVSVTFLNGYVYNDVFTNRNVRMSKVLSKIKKNVNIPDGTIFYIKNSSRYNDYIYIEPCSLLLFVMIYDSPNLYKLDLIAIIT